MIRPVVLEDMGNLRRYRNKWYRLGIFRQDRDITIDEQFKWFKNEPNLGVIINESAYGKLYESGEISFYGFDEWKIEDLKELMGESCYLHGECYLNNPYLTLWLDVGFKVIGHKKNRKYWFPRMWDSLILEYKR